MCLHAGKIRRLKTQKASLCSRRFTYVSFIIRSTRMEVFGMYWRIYLVFPLYFPASVGFQVVCAHAARNAQDSTPRVTNTRRAGVQFQTWLLRAWCRTARLAPFARCPSVPLPLTTRRPTGTTVFVALYLAGYVVPNMTTDLHMFVFTCFTFDRWPLLCTPWCLRCECVRQPSQDELVQGGF